MEVAIHEITDVEKELTIEVTAEELIPHFEKAYREYQPKLAIKGFRKGKVPLDIVKKLYGEKIEYDSLDTVASTLYRDVVKQKNITPIGDPVLVNIDYKRGESLAFKVKYEVLPAFEVKEYTGIQVEKVIHVTTDREIEDEIDLIRRANAVFLAVERADDDEHVVTVDIQELDETGFPVIGRKTENQRIYLGDENLVAELKAALRHAAVGDSQRVQYERQHGDHAHKTNIQVTVKKVEKIQLPPLDEEFVKKVTKERITSVDDFRADLRREIERYWNERSERRLVDELLSEIVRRHDFPVPESLVQAIISERLEDIRKRMPGKQLPPDFDEQRFREESRPSAVFQTRWVLIRDRIIEKEAIAVDDAELTALAQAKARELAVESQRLVDAFRSSDEIRQRLLSDKLLSFLKSKAKITERATEEPF